MAPSTSSSASALASELRMLQASNANSAMPIARTNLRSIQSAKGARRAHPQSVHHVRQMAKLTTAVKSGDLSLSHSASQTSLAISTRPGPLAALKVLPPPIVRPHTAGAFKARKVEPTRFRYFYDRGDLPVRVNFAGAVRKLQWQVDLSLLNFSHYLPVFMEGLRELEEPYHFLALNGTLDMLEKGGSRVLPCLAQMIPPMKANLMTRNQTVLCLQMKVLQRLVLCCPYSGEALVPYYRQLLSIFNLFITKRVNCGDSIDYAQRRQENVGDLILETLNILEKHGGPDAYVNIKYMIPTYESCMTRR
ncbi:Parkin coregulated protein [Phytophthora citrophthora]|uniref:Parkin coregulated protein n=1 Tax=Phytophthora citrophthora TaxID=4793 RepID=A0AAD9G0V3_9STRA|nr:Parkin coregulated protein [Phytophthora citrophthora]